MSTKDTNTYTRPSTLATRNLISPSDDKPTLIRASTSNYEQAVAAARAEAVNNASTDASPTRPGTLDRQQSYTKDDLKRAHTESMLEDKKPGLGYTSASSAVAES